MKDQESPKVHISINCLCFSVLTPGQDLFGSFNPHPHTISSRSVGGPRRRSTDSRESLVSHGSQPGQPGTASSTLRRRTDTSASGAMTLSRRGSRHRCDNGPSSRPRSPLAVSPATPIYSKKDLGISEPGKTPAQDISDR